MAKLHSNKSVGDLQGTVGNLVYVHRADGTVVVRRIPPRPTGFTAPQKANRGRFAQAQLYVKRLEANPEQMCAVQTSRQDQS